LSNELGRLPVHAADNFPKLADHLPAPMLLQKQRRPRFGIRAKADRGDNDGIFFLLELESALLLGAAEEQGGFFQNIDDFDRLLLGDAGVLEYGLAGWSAGRRLEAAIRDMQHDGTQIDLRIAFPMTGDGYFKFAGIGFEQLPQFGRIFGGAGLGLIL